MVWNVWITWYGLLGLHSMDCMNYMVWITWYELQGLHGMDCMDYMVWIALITWYGLHGLDGMDCMDYMIWIAWITWYGLHRLRATDLTWEYIITGINWRFFNKKNSPYFWPGAPCEGYILYLS